MTYMEALKKVVRALYTLKPEDQVEFVRVCWRTFEKDVFIFPMKEYNVFCKEHWGKENLFSTNRTMFDREFNLKDTWCMYVPKWNRFESAKEPKYFCYFNLSEAMEAFLTIPELMESKMGFSKEEIAEMKKAVEERGNV